MRRPRILVADDEPMIAALITRALSRVCDVVAVPDGEDALRLVTAGEQFEVIMLDLAMHRVGGIDVYEALVTRAPQLAARVVFLTGGAVHGHDHSFLERTVQPRLDKPFSIAELRALVERMLVPRSD